MTRLVWLGLAACCVAISGCGDADSVALGDGPTPGCIDGDVEQQRYGTACLCCHRDEFSVAGSVDRAAAPISRVVVSDASGQSVEVVPNAFGNFFRHLKLQPPLTATVFGPDGRSLTMGKPAPHGDCNACHRPEGPRPPLFGPP